MGTPEAGAIGKAIIEFTTIKSTVTLHFHIMTTLIQPPFNLQEQRVVLSSVTWQQYESLLATLGDYPGLRLIYLEGTLEIFMPPPEHEMIKKVIARLLERYTEEVDIPLHGYGSTTFRRQAKARGLEPDECYCVNTLRELPDFAIEVNLTNIFAPRISPRRSKNSSRLCDRIKGD